MTDEDVIQRPKGRRNNSIDLGPSTTEEPPAKERKTLSFGKRKDEAASTEESSKKPSLSFTRKQSQTVEEPVQRQEPVFKSATGTRPPVQEQTRTDLPKPRSASIDLSQTRPVHSQQRTMDLGQTKPSQQQTQRSVDLSQTESKPKSQNTIDLNPTTSGKTRGTVDLGPSQTGSQTQTETKKKSAFAGIAGALPFGKKEETEDRKGTWGDTGYHATDDQAHRDARYHIPSFMKQTMIMFMVQMKLFSKMKWTYFMLFMALLIPIVVLVAGDILDMMMANFGFISEYSNTYIAGLLAFLPLFVGLFTSILCGTQLPHEFKERTAYMNVSLPMSRISFYLGKYLAGFVMCLGVFMFAYGMAIATATMNYDTIFSDLLSESLALTIIAVFAYSATAYCVGSFMRRGSSMVPFILMSVALPALFTLLFAYFLDDGPDLSWVFMMPCFLGEAALGLLGAQVSASAGIVVLPFMDITSVGTMAGIGIVWGVIFLLLGMVKTIRREM